MKIQIKNRFDDSIIFEHESENNTIKETLLKAIESGANLYGANLDGANLDGANLDGANLDGANLYGANLYGANLSGANLYGANLYGANLDGANLSGANLYGANLYGANLYGANLSGANLYGANLSSANLDGADLSGANLYGAKDENGNIIIKYLHIKGSEHMVSWYGNNKIQIGCHTKTIEKWKECYEAVGVSESYEPDQIAEYKTYIIFCEQMQNSLVREETL
jgi:hypothetical protein